MPGVQDRVIVVTGAGGGLGDLGTQYAVRAELPRFVDIDDKTVWERLPEWTEESFAGTLLNVAAGRVTNRMDFGGLNFTIDAACASSLAAISIAVNELESGRTSVAIAGGIDTVQSPFGFLCFSKTQALSPNGKPKTFDQGADGIAILGRAVVEDHLGVADQPRRFQRQQPCAVDHDARLGNPLAPHTLL